MLTSLYIKNFILIDQLNLSFNDGFSVFTGETGAGKSIFIDAIGILCGDRLTASMVKNGSDKAVIEGTFEVDERLAALLREAGYDDDTLIVTREITREGKSITRVNQRSATVGFVRSCLSPFIDIHCQRDSQYLLNDKHHLGLLDRYSQDEKELNELNRLYKEYRTKKDRYDDLTNNEFSEVQLEMLRYQLKEISSLEPKPGEIEAIEETLKIARQKEKLQNTVEEIRELFAGDDGILSGLYSFNRLADRLNDFAPISENVSNIINSYYAINEDYETMMDYLQKDNYSLEDIDALNSRLYDLQRIRRKYNLSIEGLLARKQEIQQQLKEAENRDDILRELKKETDKAFEEYRKWAVKVSEIRRQKSLLLERDILAQLKDLNLEKARFKVAFSESKPSSLGIDTVSFLISMNPGQPLKPLQDVASGGELSRLMLGLKTVFARLNGTRLIIFDEIDTGVSGYVAFNIGVKMHEISKSIQTFCVTHLAMVASHGDHHYRISKSQKDDDTVTEVQELDEFARISELAVLSSSNTSETALAASRELLIKARESHHEGN